MSPESARAMASDYMHWAKTQPAVTQRLSASDMPHFRLDTLPLTLADLDLDGASHPRYRPLREAIAGRYGITPDNVVAADAFGLSDLGIDHPTGMAAIAPSYLWRYRVGGQFAEAPAH